MKMEIKFLSKEMLKPSKPTPNHLKTHKLCLLDQLAPERYISAILFYPSENNGNFSAEKTLLQLKESLAETLTLFYPFAGIMKDALSIDCNDSGVLYFEAQADCQLSDFLARPYPPLLGKFFSFNPRCNQADKPLVILQVTVFECGGLAISSQLFHKLGDASSMSTFLNTWACNVNNKPVQTPDLFSSSSMFPGRPDLSVETLSVLEDMFEQKETKEEQSKRRFVFDAKALASITANAVSEDIPNPSRVEALTAFLCKQFIGIKASKGSKGDASMMWHAVNLRPRMDPPLPENAVGNFLWLAVSFIEDLNASVSELVVSLNDMISNYTSDAIKSLQGDDGFVTISNMFKDMGDLLKNAKLDVFRFTSWRKMGFYEINFGWGKPVWVAQNGEFVKFIDLSNIVMFQNYGLGGIEAWVTLDKEEMEMLENDPKFLELATPNPHVLGD